MKNFYCQNKCTDIWYQYEKENGVTAFFLEPLELEKWIEQNGAEVIEFVDGVLLDNMMIATENGYAAIYEHAQTAWTSVYYIEFQHGEAATVWENWTEFVYSIRAEEAQQ